VQGALSNTKARARRVSGDRSRFREEFSGGRHLKQRLGGGKMQAKTVVLKEVKSGRKSDKLVNALSLLTEL
jgi:hypothetical protein